MVVRRCLINITS